MSDKKNESFEDMMDRLFTTITGSQNWKRVNRLDLFKLVFDDRQEIIDGLEASHKQMLESAWSNKNKIDELEKKLQTPKFNKAGVTYASYEAKCKEVETLKSAYLKACEVIEFYGSSDNWEQNGISEAFTILNDTDFKASKFIDSPEHKAALEVVK